MGRSSSMAQAMDGDDMTQINLLCINGWGGAITSTSLRGLWQRTTAKFGNTIYAPPPVNHQETGLILRYLHQWKAPSIIVGLSCGDSTINAIANADPTEPFPYCIYYSPSIYCGIGYVPANVAKATQVSSWPMDFFNPGSRQLVVAKAGNKTTKIDTIRTGYGHGFTPNSPEAQARLWAEIALAQKGK